jgi:Rrf2 family cysteine metabolism transcriptional repressor
MRLSTRARYGTRALLDIAVHAQVSPAQLKDIAERQQISPAYLQQVVSPLLAAGLVRSSRGSKGGFRMGKAPEKIRLIEVIRILEGSLMLVECVGSPETCSRSGHCVTRDVWSEVGAAMVGVLESITLQDLVERQRVKQQLRETSYHI